MEKMRNRSEEFNSASLKVSEGLENITHEILCCKKCELWKTKTRYVPGDGNPYSRIVFVGEAPGREEDRQGKPFVGAAGKLLEESIQKYLRLKREEVFICNILKCRPPGNRDPEPDEIQACFPYLERQIDIIRPKLIVCLGRFAASKLFEYFGVDFRGITRDRGKVFTIERWGGKIKLVATYHPAAILYKRDLGEIFSRDFHLMASLLKGDTGKNNDRAKGKHRDTRLLDFF
jgi:DNA polymerase